MSASPPLDLRRTHSAGEALETPVSARLSTHHRSSNAGSPPNITISPPSSATLRTNDIGSNNTSAAGQIPSPFLLNVPQGSAGSAEAEGEERPSSGPHLQNNLSLYTRTMSFLGYGRNASRARRSLVSMYTNVAWCSIQLVVIVILLAIAAAKKSPTDPSLNEWQACSRPLGIWAALWVGRAMLSGILAYWGWTRDRIVQSMHGDTEAGHRRRVRRQQRQQELRVNDEGYPGLPPGHPHHSHGEALNRPSSPPLPHSNLFSRLSLINSLLTLAWFLTAHILEYTSINTCRHSSPHLWWLVFAILCTMYLMVLEVVILGFVVFIIAPMIFLFWNIFLIIIGRHPLQHPQAIKPEIGKLPKSAVDQIPLVIYIPPPPDDDSNGTDSNDPTAVTVPEAAYTYPPQPPKPKSTKKPRRRFKFLRRLKRSETENSGKTGEGSAGHGDEESGEKKALETWEDRWEAGEYPFVRIQGNRAVCSICLMDFEEPKRIAGKTDGDQEAPTPENAGEGGVEEVPVEDMTEAERAEQLMLSDAGEGSQPLRLLACGHAFHKTCIDPWLTDVSGRCPVCQKPVEVVPPKKQPERGERHWWGGRRRQQ